MNLADVGICLWIGVIFGLLFGWKFALGACAFAMALTCCVQDSD